jgi:predicted DNA binding protein
MIAIEFRIEYPFLRDAFLRVPEMRAEWVRNTAAQGDRKMLFWASGDDFDRFEAAIQDDPTGRLVRSIDVGERRLYQVELRDATDDVGRALYEVLLDTAGFVRSAIGTHEGWYCHVVVPDREALARFFEASREQEIGYEIIRFYEMTDAKTEDFGLTEPQREAFETAFDRGYFEVPRACSLQDLSEQLGISDTAVSMRLRRAIRSIGERTIAIDDGSTTNAERSQ